MGRKHRNISELQEGETYKIRYDHPLGATWVEGVVKDVNYKNSIKVVTGTGFTFLRPEKILYYQQQGR